MLTKNINFKTIVDDLNIKPTVKKDYINLENKETIENKIYNFRKDITYNLKMMELLFFIK